MQYSYYPGCSLEATGVEYNLSTRAVAGALGLELVELPGWTCCGSSSAHAVNKDLALGLAAHNIALAQEQGRDLVVPCSACYTRLSKADHEMRHDPEERARGEMLAGFSYTGEIQIYSFLEVVRVQVGMERVAQTVRRPLTGLKLACYYGCLLVRPPEVRPFDRAEDPTSLDELAAALGAEPVPWCYKTTCCGAGLSLTRPEVVEQLVARLLSAAREAGADALVSACPLCQNNLEMRRPAQEDIPVFYFTELMGLAFGLGEAPGWLKKHLVDPFPLLQRFSLAG
ncbi:CoB--CoM heterodisulfide reductase iron-sulfur subunit B family protein [Desulfofundulus thermosubterraneus]|uniref:Heterodisulfide reductase subunit B n=1 Tax=Desulfofundulus thermosubterraneus DSM 16057 TaxID=1121432 RepID=A0A1M6DU41_9FIRM|nr:CoB--CoM heterodisulfide reductase iron-sulfur subunit B family protein [Desulfofundulus thermosubterraneus]SHI76650.1 heterodisulfide reductase subunit B [Desulfofundulus thermosubterraneus DSM 16057]